MSGGRGGRSRDGGPPREPAGTESFPRQKARTQNFTLGLARSFRVSPSGRRVVFLRSRGGDDPVTCLWTYEVAEGEERLVADPRDLGLPGGGATAPSPSEQAQRERKREAAGGIVSYATDDDATVAVFVLSGALWLCDLADGRCRLLDVPTPVLDAQLDPTGARVGFVHEGALYVLTLADASVTRLAGDAGAGITWGLAEFVAAEEMARHRGYWWAPDGAALLAARVDVGPVERWWISDPADPRRPPREVAYPAAGTANALVTLHVLPVAGGAPVQVAWDLPSYPYLARACWDRRGPLIAVQSRDQRSVEILAVDADTGATTRLGSQRDDAWVDLVGGVPRRLADGRCVMVGFVGDSAALLVDGGPVTPAGLNVREVLDVAGDRITFTASEEPTEVHVWRWRSGGELGRLTDEAGVHTAAVGGETLVIGSSALEHDDIRWRAGKHVFRSDAEPSITSPRVELMCVGERGLRVGVTFPTDHPAGEKLPVLMDPYGGPGSQRVLRARRLWREAQWLADQGFAVVVADGRGTPGRGRSWSHALHRDLAGPPLEDQIEALLTVASVHRELDLSRVAIRGWSFGGYLAALAVLRRPDVFRAAIAGAPVTDWRLYDTHYTERYLGTEPSGRDRECYEQSSLLRDAANLRRPMMLIHGLADDNVVVAHSLTLSRALSESGRAHTVLPLSGVTHMTPQPAVAESLLHLQIRFLREALQRSS